MISPSGTTSVHPETLTVINGIQSADIGGLTAVVTPVQVGALTG